MACYDVVYNHVVEIKLDVPNPSSYLNQIQLNWNAVLFQS